MPADPIPLGPQDDALAPRPSDRRTRIQAPRSMSDQEQGRSQNSWERRHIREASHIADRRLRPVPGISRRASAPPNPRALCLTGGPSSAPPRAQHQNTCPSQLSVSQRPGARVSRGGRANRPPGVSPHVRHRNSPLARWVAFRPGVPPQQGSVAGAAHACHHPRARPCPPAGHSRRRRLQAPCRYAHDLCCQHSSNRWQAQPLWAVWAGRGYVNSGRLGRDGLGPRAARPSIQGGVPRVPDIPASGAGGPVTTGLTGR